MPNLNLLPGRYSKAKPTDGNGSESAGRASKRDADRPLNCLGSAPFSLFELATAPLVLHSDSTAFAALSDPHRTSPLLPSCIPTTSITVATLKRPAHFSHPIANGFGYR